MKSSERRFYLAQDMEDRWYVVPVDQEDDFEELLEIIDSGYAGSEDWHQWEENYKPLAHDLSHYSFTDFREGHDPHRGPEDDAIHEQNMEWMLALARKQAGALFT